MALLGGGVFERCFICEGVAFMNGISVLIKETYQRSLSTSTIQEYNEKSMTRKGPHLTTLALWSQTSSLQNCEKQIFVVYKSPRVWDFVIASWMDYGIVLKLAWYSLKFCYCF